MRVRARRTIELDVELARRLEDLARERGVSVNQTIQDLLRMALNREGYSVGHRNEDRQGR